MTKLKVLVLCSPYFAGNSITGWNFLGFFHNILKNSNLMVKLASSERFWTSEKLMWQGKCVTTVAFTREFAVEFCVTRKCITTVDFTKDFIGYFTKVENCFRLTLRHLYPPPNTTRDSTIFAMIHTTSSWEPGIISCIALIMEGLRSRTWIEKESHIVSEYRQLLLLVFWRFTWARRLYVFSR
jgi:hypothetical protein